MPQISNRFGQVIWFLVPAAADCSPRPQVVATTMAPRSNNPLARPLLAQPFLVAPLSQGCAANSAAHCAEPELRLGSRFFSDVLCLLERTETCN
jgi:hypothetical protein